ncbi:MAG: ABC transporter substrate-binding protein [Proteobacteria bacterium]|nr:ABC transporter substrate-binding protein [Pseudomonadota bacterium]
MRAIRSIGLSALCVVAFSLPAAAQFANDTVKIGVLTDEVGPYADSAGPGSILAAQMAVADFGGTVKGHKVEIVHGDTANKPDVAANLARRWFDTEGVSAVVDLPVTPVAFAVQDVAVQKKKTVMITAAATTDITSKRCNIVSTHWADDNHALAGGTAKAIMANGGGKSWYFITVDIAFGTALQKDATGVIEAGGGKVLGSVRYPVGNADFSSLLLQAQSSKAEDVGLASVGADLVNAIKQAHEFGLGKPPGPALVGFLIYINDIHALGLEATQRLNVMSSFYWDENDAARKFAQRFFEKRKAMPSRDQAQIYTAVLHYLKAIDAAGTDDAAAVGRKMREMPVDYFGKSVTLRSDGRLMSDLTLYRVKAPAESKRPWDYYEPVRTVPSAEAYLPANPACNP